MNTQKIFFYSFVLFFFQLAIASELDTSLPAGKRASRVRTLLDLAADVALPAIRVTQDESGTLEVSASSALIDEALTNNVIMPRKLPEVILQAFSTKTMTCASALSLINTYRPTDDRLKMLTYMVLASHEFPDPKPTNRHKAYQEKWREQFDQWIVNEKIDVSKDPVLARLAEIARGQGLSSACCFGIAPYCESKLERLRSIMEHASYDKKAWKESLGLRDSWRKATGLFYSATWRTIAGAPIQPSVDLLDFLLSIGYKVDASVKQDPNHELNRALIICIDRCLWEKSVADAAVRLPQRLQLMERLIKIGAPVQFPNAALEEQPLYHALRKNLKPCVLTLLRTGFDIRRKVPVKRASGTMVELTYEEHFMKKMQSKVASVSSPATEALKLYYECLDELGIKYVRAQPHGVKRKREVSTNETQ